MKIQELFLAAAEPSHIDNLRGVYAHSLERGKMSDRGNYELPVVLEANEPAIEEMIDAGCQKQAVLAVYPSLRAYFGRTISRPAQSCVDAAEAALIGAAPAMSAARNAFGH